MMRIIKIWYNSLPDHHIIKHKHKRRLLLSSVGLIATSIFYFSNQQPQKVPIDVNPQNVQKLQTEYKRAKILIKFKEADSQRIKEFFNNPPASYSEKFQPLKLRNNILRAQKIYSNTSKDAQKYYELDISMYSDPKNVASDFEKSNIVEYAEPDYAVSADLAPNDPYFYTSRSWGQLYDDQWNLKKIKLPDAWEIENGSSEITVAVVDTGIDFEHPDLAQNVWINSDELPSGGNDNDGNGYINDWRGYNFYAEDNDITDDHGHGTHVSGIISAVTNNDIGIAGTNWSTKIMGLKFLNSDGYGWSSDGARAIRYAADNGAKVINCSWSGTGYSQVIADAVNYAYSKGAVVIAAAGNSGSSAKGYSPAGLDHVVSVAALDAYDQIPSWSNYDVSLSAPGSNILSLRAAGTSMGNAISQYYTVASGTSMASPHVAGLAALILSKNRNIVVDRLVDFLQLSTDDLGQIGYDKYYGFGRINGQLALNLSPTHPNGSLLKGIQENNIYLIENQKKRYIPSWPIFIQRYNSKEIINISRQELDEYEDGENLNFLEGSLLKFGTSPNIYFFENNKLRLIISAEVFLKLGFSWREIITLSAADINNYEIGENLQNFDIHPNGSLIKKSGESSVYLLENNQKRHIIAWQVYLQRFKNRSIINISEQEFNQYQEGQILGFREGTLLKSYTSIDVYFIEGDIKKPILGAMTFRAFGFRWDNIIKVTDSILNQYRSGEYLR